MNTKIHIVFFFTFLTLFSSCLFGGQSSSSSSEKKQIHIWNLYDTQDTFKGAMESYASKNNVSFQYKTFVNEEEYKNLLLQYLASGKGPDIFALKNTWVHEYKDTIDPFIEAGTITNTVLDPSLFETTFFQTAYKDLVHENRVYGIPLSIDSLGLYYNKQMFKDGSSSPIPGKTWENIEQQSRQLTRKNPNNNEILISGISLGSLKTISRGRDILTSLMLQYNTLTHENNEIRLATQRVRDPKTGNTITPAEEAFAYFYSYANPSHQNYQWNEAFSVSSQYKEQEMFLRGNLAMITGYSYLYEDLKRLRNTLARSGSVIREADIGITEFPQRYHPDEQIQQNVLALYYPLTVSRHSQVKDHAWNFLVFLSSSENIMTYHEKTSKPPSRYDAAQEINSPLYQPFIKQAQFAQTFPQAPLQETWIQTAFIQAEESYTVKRESLKSSIRQAHDGIQCFVKQSYTLGENTEPCYK